MMDLIKCIPLENQSSLTPLIFVCFILKINIQDLTLLHIQSFAPGRHAGFDDVVADVIGTCVFLGAWKIKQSKRSRA